MKIWKKSIFYELIALAESLNRLKYHNLKKEQYEIIIEVGNSLKHNYWVDRTKIILEMIKDDFFSLKEDLENELIKN